jgi:transposase
MNRDPALVLHPPKRVGHLPLIMDTLRRTGILNAIDSICGVDARMKVTHSDCVAFVLLGVFAGEHGLWRLSQRLDPFDLTTIMDDAGLDTKEFYDVRLGRMLDAIYDAGPDRLYSAIALPLIESESLGLETLHLDPTSLSFYGAYEDELDEPWAPELSPELNPDLVPLRQPRINETPDGDGREAPLVVHGYAKNQRMDLKQVLFGMVVTSDGGIPLYGRAFNGNTSDVTVACEFLDRLRTMLPDPSSQCFVADCKVWSPGSLDVVRQHSLRLLSRLPRSTGLAQELVYAFTAETAPCLLHKYHKDRGRWSWITYEGRDSVYTYDFHEPVCDDAGKARMDERGKPLTRKVVHRLPVRAVTCFSSELYRQKCETLGAVSAREDLKCTELIERLQRRTFACRADAEDELQRLGKKQPFITRSIMGTVIPRTVRVRRARRGRPPAGTIAPAPLTRFALSLAARKATPEENGYRLRRAACYVLIRSRTSDWVMTDEQMIASYSRQWKCEHGFSWLKSQAAINPMFVENTRRIEALCFLYTLALIVHTLIQRNVRKYLKKEQQGLPYHRDKPSDNITSRFFYELYRGVTTQVVEVNGRREKKIYGTNQWTELGLSAMGASPRAYKPVLEAARK